MARAELGDQVVIVDSMEDCVSGADCVLVCNPDEEFKSLTADMILGERKSAVVVDYWRILNESLGNDPRIDYIPFGCSVNDEANGAALREMWEDGGVA